MNAEYLGDGVYIQQFPNCPERGLVLTTGSHKMANADAIVYLEPQVLDKLCDYIIKQRKSKIPDIGMSQDWTDLAKFREAAEKEGFCLIKRSEAQEVKHPEADAEHDIG